MKKVKKKENMERPRKSKKYYLNCSKDKFISRAGIQGRICRILGQSGNGNIFQHKVKKETKKLQTVPTS